MGTQRALYLLVNTYELKYASCSPNYLPFHQLDHLDQDLHLDQIFPLDLQDHLLLLDLMGLLLPMIGR